ncbi:MAG: hypothetical protein WBM09_04945 [Gallionella sp.]
MRNLAAKSARDKVLICGFDFRVRHPGSISPAGGQRRARKIPFIRIPAPIVRQKWQNWNGRPTIRINSMKGIKT